MLPAFADLQVVVLAAGQGKRMRSRTPKVLHPVLGVPMLELVLHAVEQLSPAGIAVVVGEHEAKIRKALGDPAN
ncbi:MAG: UDP-N-acetylglucosamine diphosphorylase/glucosamine-1-phosphate N-acetyltransferase, partial [Zetaproteobacteria bacterium]